MGEKATTTTKKTARRKTTVTAAANAAPVSPQEKQLPSIRDTFNELGNQLTVVRDGFEALGKEIVEMRQWWEKEKKDHQQEMALRNQQEEISRKREEEIYEYDLQMKRRKAEDEFNLQKWSWERELAQQKETITKERQELVELRKQVVSLETEKVKAVKEACNILQKELTEKFQMEKRLREQEVKAEKELLTLKISQLTAEGNRQMVEIATLKKAFDQATAQVKEIAVKVIEAGGQATKPQALPGLKAA